MIMRMAAMYLAVAVLCCASAATASTPPPPPGATALCKDGTYSYSQHHSGTCSHHGGVAEWLDGSSGSSASSGGSSGSSKTSLASALPSAHDAYYATRSAVSRAGAPRAVAAESIGGWRATYRDTGAGRPWARVTLLAYRGAVSANKAMVLTCPPGKCQQQSVVKHGIRLVVRYRGWRSGSAYCLRAVGVSGSNEVTVDTCATVDDKGKPYSLAKLQFDAGFLIGNVQARAAALT